MYCRRNLVFNTLGRLLYIRKRPLGRAEGPAERLPPSGGTAEPQPNVCERQRAGRRHGRRRCCGGTRAAHGRHTGGARWRRAVWWLRPSASGRRLCGVGSVGRCGAFSAAAASRRRRPWGASQRRIGSCPSGAVRRLLLGLRPSRRRRRRGGASLAAVRPWGLQARCARGGFFPPTAVHQRKKGL